MCTSSLLKPDLRLPNVTIAAQSTVCTVHFSFQVQMPPWPMNWLAIMLVTSCFRHHSDLLLCRLFLGRSRKVTTTVPQSESYPSLSQCALQLATPQVLSHTVKCSISSIWLCVPSAVTTAVFLALCHTQCSVSKASASPWQPAVIITAAFQLNCV